MVIQDTALQHETSFPGAEDRSKMFVLVVEPKERKKYARRKIFAILGTF